MFRQLLIFLFSFSILHANWDELFPQSDDPVITHHVNVITGQLTFSVTDTILQGPTPIPFVRTYSSSGAFESIDNRDKLKAATLNNTAVAGGWNFLSHLHLLIECRSKYPYKAYITESSLESVSKWHEKSVFIYDHGFLAPTGDQVMQNWTQELRKDYGFHNSSTR